MRIKCKIATRFALFELVRELLEIRRAKRRSLISAPYRPASALLEQRVPMKPSFLAACVAACQRCPSEPGAEAHSATSAHRTARAP